MVYQHHLSSAQPRDRYAPDGHPIIHISEVGTYKKCRRLWEWSGRNKGNLEPRKLYSPFFVGNALHHCLEQLNSDGTPPHLSLFGFLRNELSVRRHLPLWEFERPKIRKDTTLIRAMLAQYVAWVHQYRGPYNDAELDYLCHEMRFGQVDDTGVDPVGLIPLRAGGQILLPIVYLAGKLDGLARHTPEGLLITEYKSCRSVVERVKLLPHDEQATTYCFAAQEIFGEPVQGVLYTLLRKKEATHPRVLKNGMLSVAQSIDTTPEMYMADIIRHHGLVSKAFIHQHYGEVLESLRTSPEPFVARILVRRTPQQIDAYIRELHQTALEMNDPHTPITATRTWTCPNCLFREPCLARDECDESQVQSILRFEYQERPRITDDLGEEF